MAGISTGISLLTVGVSAVKNLSFWLDGSSLNDSVAARSPTGSLNFSSSSPVSASLGSYYTTNGLSSTALTYPNLNGAFNLASVQCTVGVWIKIISGSPSTNDYEIVRLASASSSANVASLVVSRAFGNWYLYVNSLYGTTSTSTITLPTNTWVFIAMRVYTNGSLGFVEAIRYDGDVGGVGSYTTNRKNASGSSSYDLNQNPVILNTNLRGSGTDFQIDSLGIWNLQLSNSELDTVVNHGAGLTYAQLQALI